MAIRTAVNRALTEITALPTAAALVNGNLTLLTTATASSSANLTFDSSIDSTYDSYVFKYYNIHPQTDGKHLQVGFRDGSTAYDATKTTTFFRAGHDEDGSNNESYLGYRTDSDLAQGTGAQRVGIFVGADNDQCCNGELHLFDPSSTTFVKHFMARTSNNYYVDYIQDEYMAGYCNVTAAIDGVQFSMSSGNIDSGVIKMYGVGDIQ